jgi:predicted DNA-binding antitoxin AbrB/MazE fold protein
MVIHIDATYENGVLRPSKPLNLPNQTPVHVTVVPQEQLEHSNSSAEEELPEGPMVSLDDFRRILNAGTIRAGSLPNDFDRDDIYSDHD